jgi:hypothetical protein
VTFPSIIGLNGVARSGKDTVAGILHDLYGYEIITDEDGASGFSVMLNKALRALDPVVTLERVATGEFSQARYADILNAMGYEAAKEIPEVRRLLQAMGTEVGRNLLGADIWVDALFKNLPREKVAITNVRFPNEYEAVKSRGGVVWRVDRPGFEAANGHISDTALDGYSFDAHIYNEGTIRDLATKVMRLLDPVQSVFV